MVRSELSSGHGLLSCAQRNAGLSQRIARRHDKILSLRRRIAALEPPSKSLCSETTPLPRSDTSLWRIGVADIDMALPRGQLSQDSVHEIVSSCHADTPAAFGYLLSLINRLQTVSGSAHRKTILLCQTAKMQHEFGPIYTHGLQTFGINPADIICVHAAKNSDALWTLEEGVRSGCLLAAVGEIENASFTETRRLSLASETTGTPTLLLRTHRDAGVSAAVTRWHVRAHRSGPTQLVPSAPNEARWHVELNRCRGGQPGTWRVEWHHETHRFSLVEDICTRSLDVADAQIRTHALRQAS